MEPRPPNAWYDLLCRSPKNDIPGGPQSAPSIVQDWEDWQVSHRPNCSGCGTCRGVKEALDWWYDDNPIEPFQHFIEDDF
jgi:hypothetical protein